MAGDPQITLPTARVLSALLDAAPNSASGAEVAKATGLASGSLYPILIRLERAGWLSSEWEVENPRQLGRPRRRLYSITSIGRAKIRAVARSLVPIAGKLAWA